MGAGHREKVRHRPAGGATRTARALLAAIAALLLAVPCASAATRVWAVGDGGVADRGDDDLAARVGAWGIDRLLYLGDVYESGSAQEFRNYYAPGWGRFKSITRPVPGNHEWGARAEGYDPYWGRRARGRRGAHYYSFDIGAWHLVALNSHEDSGPSSRQVAWLRRDLRRFGGTCTIAFWHRPRYTAGVHRDAEDTEPFWDALAGRAAVVLNGHDHNYQRLRRTRGITQFVVGTGGRRPLHPVDRSQARLASAHDSVLGALRLALGRSGLAYEYRSTAGAALDSGRLGCRAHRPRIAIGRRARRAVVPRGTRTLGGRARGYVGPLRVSLVRRGRASGCRSFDGRRFRRSSCRSPRRFALRDRGRWRVRLPAGRGLRPGAYVLRVSAADPAGRRGSARTRFRVR